MISECIARVNYQSKLDTNSWKKCFIDFDVIMTRHTRQRYANGIKKPNK